MRYICIFVSANSFFQITNVLLIYTYIHICTFKMYYKSLLIFANNFKCKQCQMSTMYFYSGSSGTHSICVCTYCHNPSLALTGSGMAYEGPFKNIFGADHERHMTTKVLMISFS